MDSRKFSEKPEKQKGYKFNIIDFALIVLIAAAVSVLVYIMLGNNLLAAKEDTTIIYTIEIPLIRNELIPAINQIDRGVTKIIDSIRGYDIGVIQDYKITDAYSNQMDPEAGAVFKKPYPDHSKVVITVKSQCTKGKVRYLINGKTSMVGVQIHFRTPTFISYGNCTYLVEVNEDGSKKSGDLTTETETGGDMGGE